ncbi:MAG: DUF1449 family protein [Candidatus Accumulibacter sp.]|jgi:hypothetical protein|nr:DUF1449 family protein [Accumulibacter sp.]
MELLAVLTAYPTAIYTALLGVVLVYWLLAVAGLVDFSSGVDLDLDIGGDAGDVSHVQNLDGEVGEGGSSVTTLAGLLVAFGLGGVPFSVVVSLLAFISWFVCALASLWILPWVPTDLLRFAAATGILAGAFAAAVPLAAACVRPLRGLFARSYAVSNASLVGRECLILTGSVDEKFGRAQVSGDGEDFHVRVVADVPNSLKRGDFAHIVDYDETARVYRVVANS